jgi:hypothetical protein
MPISRQKVSDGSLLTTPGQRLDSRLPRSSAPHPNFMSVVDVGQAEPQWRAEDQGPSRQTA